MWKGFFFHHHKLIVVTWVFITQAVVVLVRSLDHQPLRTSTSHRKIHNGYNHGNGGEAIVSTPPHSSLLTATKDSQKLKLHIRPSVVEIDQVSVQLPRTLQRRLWSSNPHREYALRNVSLCWGNNTSNSDSSLRRWVMLTGESNSGKSALLQMIAQSINTNTANLNVNPTITSGSIRIRSVHHHYHRNVDVDDNSIHDFQNLAQDPEQEHLPIVSTAAPIYLNDPRHDTYRDCSQTLHALLTERRQNWCRKCVVRQKRKNLDGTDTASSTDADRTTKEAEMLLLLLKKHYDAVVQELARRLQLSSPTAAYWESPALDVPLSTSFRFGLLMACLDSMLSNHELPVRSFRTLDNDQEEMMDHWIVVPAPVLLLDEWLDQESSAVIHKVQESIEGLLDMGSVVCIATHTPDRFRFASSDHHTTYHSYVRHIRLQSGAVVLDDFL